jgi:nicotinate-nucleotide pyrophosphorylase (carboxylating)
MSDKSSLPLELPPLLVARAIAAALKEDLGEVGDITSDAIVPADAQGKAAIVSRQEGVVAGLDLAEAAFRALDPNIGFKRVIDDGGQVAARGTIAHISGKTRAILTGERTALNFLGRLSGIATLTASFVGAVKGTGVRITCTRKTTPGLRVLEKYAVRAGGGINHRFGLYDAVLVKDNHIAAAGGLAKALTRLRNRKGHTVRVEVEVDTLDQLRDALKFPIDAVLLDNMDIATLKKAVKLIAGRVTAEASGGVTLENVREIAATGVNVISVGALTHSPRNLDSSLEWRKR